MCQDPADVEVTSGPNYATVAQELDSSVTYSGDGAGSLGRRHGAEEAAEDGKDANDDGRVLVTDRVTARWKWMPAHRAPRWTST